MNVRLVVFDVDGTLTQHSSVWWRLHELFGTTKEGKLYFTNLDPAIEKTFTIMGLFQFAEKVDSIDEIK